MIDGIYSQVKIDYYDEETRAWCVDAWKGGEDDGEVVAKIDGETFQMTFNNDECYHSREFWITVTNFIRAQAKSE